MAEVLVIDDGRKQYEIRSKKGELLGELSFNPSDTNMVKRYDEAIKRLNAIGKDIPDNITTAEAIKMAEGMISEHIDYLFGYEVAENFFKITGPLSPLASGMFYFEAVLEVVAKAIEKETGERMKRANAKINKYVAKYHA